MKDLFVKLAGLHSENLTTEILKIILQEPGYEIYQRSFYNYLFSQIKKIYNDEILFEIDSQVRTEDGIPDLILTNDEMVFILENKFYAKFSGEDQVIRYLKILREKYLDRKKTVLFILTIKRQFNNYNQSIDKQLAKEGISDEKSKIVFVYWDDIIRIFKSNNFLIEALTEYIDKYYIKEITLKDEEFEMFNNKTIPETLYQIINLVEKVRNGLQNSSFNTSKMSQSINYFGFYIELEDYKCWFGYALPWWGKKGKAISPFFVQLKKEWFKNSNLSEEQIQKINDLDFVFDEEFQWIKAYRIESSSNVETEIVSKVISDLNKISQNIIK